MIIITLCMYTQLTREDVMLKIVLSLIFAISLSFSVNAETETTWDDIS